MKISIKCNRIFRYNLIITCSIYIGENYSHILIKKDVSLDWKSPVKSFDTKTQKGCQRVLEVSNGVCILSIDRKNSTCTKNQLSRFLIR